MNKKEHRLEGQCFAHTVALVTVVLGVWLSRASVVAAITTSRDDHLVPIDEIFDDQQGQLGAYRKLSESKLFVTPGDMARFLHLPGIGGTETAVSIYHDDRKAGGLPGGCWLTFTQASRLLWTFILHATDEQGDVNSVKIERRDLPLPEKTAGAIREAWLIMLAQSKKPSESVATVDSSTEIYSAVDRSGRYLAASSPPLVGRKTSALLQLTNRLIECCYVAPSERPQKLREVEAAARALSSRNRTRRGE
jgi:hypothetical protein